MARWRDSEGARKKSRVVSESVLRADYKHSTVQAAPGENNHFLHGVLHSEILKVASANDVQDALITVPSVLHASISL